MSMLLTMRRTAVSFFVGALLCCAVVWPAAAQITGPDKGGEAKRCEVQSERRAATLFEKHKEADKKINETN